MKLFKRTIALLLVLCFIGVALVACTKKPDEQGTDDAGNNGNAGNKSTETETNIYGEPSFTTTIQYENLDFEGEELTIMLRNNEVTVREWYKESTEDELDEAVAMNKIAFTITNVRAFFGVITPAGISRSAVRGFSASMRQSAQRLKPIAVLRAKIIHSTTCTSRITHCHGSERL